MVRGAASEKNSVAAATVSCITSVLYVKNAPSKYTTIFQIRCHAYTLCSSRKETGRVAKVMFLVIVGNPPHVIQ